MLSVQITPRRKKYVSFIEDTIPNKGGFFCKVYEDPNGEFESDCFTIHNYEVKNTETKTDKLKLAYKIATNKVKTMYKKEVSKYMYR